MPDDDPVALFDDVPEVVDELLESLAELLASLVELPESFGASFEDDEPSAEELLDSPSDDEAVELRLLVA